MKSNDDIKTALQEVFGDRHKGFYQKLSHYKIQTVEQLWGILNLSLPKMNEQDIKKRGLYKTYTAATKTKKTSIHIVRSLHKMLRSSEEDAALLYKRLSEVNYPQRLFRRSATTLSCGVLTGDGRVLKSFWQKKPIIRTSGSFFLLPDYYKMGGVFDQGERGTCVANAATALVDYLCSNSTSRQFLYHQCKMVDGYKNESGTFMWVPMSILSDESIIDYGTVAESDWKYNKKWEKSEDQGPPPEKCFQTERFFGYELVTARRNSFVSDVKTLLVGSNIADPVPVTVGLTLYSSFFNEYAERTGWINMPLPDDYKIGGHAMLIVGYSDEHEIFIVRNSWGESWAAENPFGLHGHALIPYDYFIHHCAPGDAITLCNFSSCKMTIPEKDRLYNRSVSLEKIDSKVAALKQSQMCFAKKKTSVFRKVFRLMIVLVLLAAILRVGKPDLFFLFQYWIVEIYLRLSNLFAEFVK